MSEEEIREKTLRTAEACLEGKTPGEKTTILHQHIGRREMTDMIIETIGPIPGEHPSAWSIFFTVQYLCMTSQLNVLHGSY